MFYFSDNSLPHKPQVQSKRLIWLICILGILGIQEKLTPFINVYKEDFENIQQKQRPFPFI